MADQLALCNDQYLFFLNEISYIALVVDTARIVACSCTLPHSAGDQRQLGFDTTDLTACLFKVALNQWSEPDHFDILPYKVTIERQIPEVLMVASD